MKVVIEIECNNARAFSSIAAHVGSIIKRKCSGEQALSRVLVDSGDGCFGMEKSPYIWKYSVDIPGLAMEPVIPKSPEPENRCLNSATMLDTETPVQCILGIHHPGKCIMETSKPPEPAECFCCGVVNGHNAGCPEADSKEQYDRACRQFDVT